MNDINDITDPNLIMVSGPVNVVRLEGNVHGIKKVIYLFMDYHMNVSNQTQCENIFSKDIQKYLVDNFYVLNDAEHMYDFFVEIYPSELSDDSYRKGITRKESKEKYIEEVVKLFRKIFRFDTKRNRVTVNKLFQNIRLHYLDIRDYYKQNVYSQISEMSNIAHGFMRNDDIDVKSLEYIIELMQIMRDHLEFVISVLAAPPKKKVSKQKIIKENSRNVDTNALIYLANKIKSSYTHNDVKKVMNLLIDLSIKNFRKTIHEIDKATNDFRMYAREIYGSYNKLVKDVNTSYLYSYGVSSFTIRKMIVNIVNTVESLMDEQFVEFFARFTDIYFLRRFLDKDYITNAVVYSGALHSNTYISVLVKYFDFKITHVSYSKTSDMNKLTTEVKKRSLMEMQELVLPQDFEQCSDMTHFPDNFE